MIFFLAKLRIVTVRKNIFFACVKKCSVSYDTLAGIPWMSHSRITKICERVSCEGPYDKITWQKLSERIKRISKSLDLIEIGRILQSYSKVHYRDVKMLYILIEEIKKKEKLAHLDLLGCASICHALNNLNFKDNELFHIIFLKIKELQINKHSSFPIIIIQNAYCRHCNENLFRHMALQLLIFFFQKFDTYKNSCTPQGLSMLLNSFAQILKPSPEFLKNRNQQLYPICLDLSNPSSNGTPLKSAEHGFQSKEKVVYLTHSNEDSSYFERNKKTATIDTEEESAPLEEVLRNHVLEESSFVEREKNPIQITIQIKEEQNMRNPMKIRGQEMWTKQKNELEKNIVEEKETCDKYRNEYLLKKYFVKLLLEISKNLEKMNPHSLALIINSCTRIPFEVSTEFLKMLTEETNKKIHLTSIRHLSLIINGYIKLKLDNPQFLSNVFNEIEKKIYSCDDQQLSFILSSMCKLNKKTDTLLKHIKSKFLLTVRKMNISTLCNIFYFYSKLGVFDEDLFHLYEIYFKRLIHEASIHHLSLASYVLSKNNKKENELISLIVEKAEQIVKPINSCSDEETEKSILILINSLSELYIFSPIMGEYLYFIVHVNETKLKAEQSKEKIEKLKKNIHHLETSVQEKILNKHIYLSVKTLSLYHTYICGVVQKVNETTI